MPQLANGHRVLSSARVVARARKRRHRNREGASFPCEGEMHPLWCAEENRALGFVCRRAVEPINFPAQTAETGPSQKPGQTHTITHGVCVGQSNSARHPNRRNRSRSGNALGKRTKSARKMHPVRSVRIVSHAIDREKSEQGEIFETRTIASQKMHSLHPFRTLWERQNERKRCF